MFKDLTQSVKTTPVTSLSARPSAGGKGRSICIVSDCAVGIGKTGMAETGNLALLLAQDGWRVTILDASPPDAPDADYPNITCQKLAGLYRESNWYIQLRSLLAYHWLRGRNFDAVIFHHTFALAFYSCMARHLSLAFIHMPIIVAASLPHMLKLERAQKFPSGRHDFECDFMEKRSLDYADAILLPDAETGIWMRQAGYAFPPAAGCLNGEGEAWGEWLGRIVDSAAASRETDMKPAFISVCMPTYNRSQLLRQALDSLQAQTYSDFEVVVVDDGSTDPDVQALGKQLAPLFAERGWRWVRQENAGPAAARNYAAKIARADHLLFMDDDNIACVDEIERFARAARQDYDILACILGMHPDCELAPPPAAYLPECAGPETRPVGWTAIGGDLVLATYANVMGETNSLFRREVFRKLGGFSTDANAVMEDVELLTRALVAGYRIDVVPEVLMLYRRTRRSRSMTQDIFNGHLHSLKPIADLLPASLRPLLLAIRNEWYARHCGRRDA